MNENKEETGQKTKMEEIRKRDLGERKKGSVGGKRR
jgi:hypothetical protein